MVIEINKQEMESLKLGDQVRSKVFTGGYQVIELNPIRLNDGFIHDHRQLVKCKVEDCKTCHAKTDAMFKCGGLKRNK